jgi:hypothetical protein
VIGEAARLVTPTKDGSNETVFTVVVSSSGKLYVTPANETDMTMTAVQENDVLYSALPVTCEHRGRMMK